MDPIGPIQEGISLDGDHRQICQFSSGDDSQYQLVLRNIQSILAPGSDGLSSQVDNPKGKYNPGTMSKMCSIINIK
jgi:hypothetical protein